MPGAVMLKARPRSLLPPDLIHAAVRSFCTVTEMQRIGSIASVRRAAMRTVQVKPVITNQVKRSEHGERRDKEGEREGATLREGRD